MRSLDANHVSTSMNTRRAEPDSVAELTRGANVTVNSVLPGPTRSEGIVDFLKSLASDPRSARRADGSRVLRQRTTILPSPADDQLTPAAAFPCT